MKLSSLPSASTSLGGSHPKRANSSTFSAAPFPTLVAVLLKVVFLLTTFSQTALADEEARALVQRAIEHWRGESSRTRALMTIHRPTWQRTSELVVITEGRKKTLVRFLSPAKDAGNASLTIGDEIWSYSPKLNRVMKIPPSMKSQSWMGSDFSYDDLSKTDDIIDQYTHRISGRSREGNYSFTEVESLPKESAPIVWGKETLLIRDDLVIVKHHFYDQEQRLVKSLEALEVKEIGGRQYATKVRMQNGEKPEEWTEVVTTEAAFQISLPEHLFTLSNLGSPRGE